MNARKNMEQGKEKVCLACHIMSRALCILTKFNYLTARPTACVVGSERVPMVVVTERILRGTSFKRYNQCSLEIVYSKAAEDIYLQEDGWVELSLVESWNFKACLLVEFDFCGNVFSFRNRQNCRKGFQLLLQWKGLDHSRRARTDHFLWKYVRIKEQVIEWGPRENPKTKF